jgi:hypothetical protein
VKTPSFRKELQDLINRHCRENYTDTPDFILAEYLSACLDAYETAVRSRSDFFNIPAGEMAP